jgi:hypothetical protein
VRRAGAVAVAVLLACSARKPEMRLTGTTISSETKADNSRHLKYTFELTMPTHGANYHLRDFVIIDSGGHSHTPTNLQVSSGSDRFDTATPTFELDDLGTPVELRAGTFRKQLHIH